MIKAGNCSFKATHSCFLTQPSAQINRHSRVYRFPAQLFLDGVLLTTGDKAVCASFRLSFHLSEWGGAMTRFSSFKYRVLVSASPNESEDYTIKCVAPKNVIIVRKCNTINTEPD